MNRLLAAAVISIALISTAEARGGLVTVKTDAGPITVASSVANKFVGFIHDLVHLVGYHPPRVHCFASHGHVRGSTHHWGGGCDFNQRGWNKTDAPMYRVGWLAKKWGLRDGCTFRHPRKDCGHIDAGLSRHLARRHLTVTRSRWARR